jgi:micrococcal nuclease
LLSYLLVELRSPLTWVAPLDFEYATVIDQPNHQQAQKQRVSGNVVAAMGLPLFQKRYETAMGIPNQEIQRKAIIYGAVVKVVDGDTIRVRHIPNYPRGVLGAASYSGKLSDNTISIRFYGVDCPETAKYGNPSMPYADEATDYTKRRVKPVTKRPSKTKNKGSDKPEVVRIKMLSRDQYGRIVGKVEATRNNLPLFLPWILPRSDLSLDLTKRGYATVYTGRGAEYDGHKELFLQALGQAQRKRVGVWSSGISSVKTPAEYKRTVKQQKQ